MLDTSLQLWCWLQVLTLRDAEIAALKRSVNELSREHNNEVPSFSQALNHHSACKTVQLAARANPVTHCALNGCNDKSTTMRLVAAAHDNEIAKKRRTLEAHQATLRKSLRAGQKHGVMDEWLSAGRNQAAVR